MKLKGSPVGGFGYVGTQQGSVHGVIGSTSGVHLSGSNPGPAGPPGGAGPQGPQAAVPVRFSSPTAVLGVSPTDRAYSPRTLTGARMRVASAPSGSALTVEVQHWDGFDWTTIGTLSIASGSVTEDTETFSQEQEVGNMVRINCTSVGSSTPATGVAVDVTVDG